MRYAFNIRVGHIRLFVADLADTGFPMISSMLHSMVLIKIIFDVV